jgi:hypothetical protein
MKIQLQPILDALKAKALPVAEKDLIIVVDAVLGSVADQAAGQPGDAVAGVLALLLAAVKPAVDAEMAKVLPAAAQA